MELVICLGVAISVFILVIVCIVGLVSAPTPILLGILLVGVMVTQKSINKLTEPEINLMDERDKNRVEKVEVAPQPTFSEKDDQKETMKSIMVYRGSNYEPSVHSDKTKKTKETATIQYRGVKLNHKQEKTV